MPRVILENISKFINGRKILDDICMEIEEKSFVCLLGPPGGGKTTLLKIIAGLILPDRGKVYFGDKDVTTVPPFKRDVGMVFQDFALYPHMSVYKNIASPLIAKKLSPLEIDQKIKEVAHLLKIEKLLSREVKKLSGGEMQRVAIGRSIAKEARIMLFDEIFVNLDYKLREQMRIEFKKLIEKAGVTTIFSSPDPEDALSLADKIAIFDKGKMRQYDSRNNLYNYPADVFTAKYFGFPEMNVLDCKITHEKKKIIINADSFKIELSPTEKKEIPEGEYLMGIRPEDISISITENPAGEISLKGKLVLTEIVGSDTIVHIRLGKHLLESFIPRMYHISDGEIWVGFKREKIILFDKKTGVFRTRGV